jgi:hypothetical protein
VKRIFALALVGLLSISSLAEEEGLGVQPTEPESVQLNRSSAELNCSGEFTKIEDKENKAGGDFCITKNVQKRQFQFVAKANCKKQDHDGKQAHLCSRKQWFLACKTKGKELIMSNENSGKIEWVADLYDGFGEVMGYSGCDSFYSSIFVANSYGSRCCFR